MCVVMNFELPVLVASYQTRVEKLNYFSSVAAGKLRLLLCPVLTLGLINHELARLDAHLNLKDTVNAFIYICCGSILTSDNALVLCNI